MLSKTVNTLLRDESRPLDVIIICFYSIKLRQGKWVVVGTGIALE